jgi:hypothetical protein
VRRGGVVLTGQERERREREERERKEALLLEVRRKREADVKIC